MYGHVPDMPRRPLWDAKHAEDLSKQLASDRFKELLSQYYAAKAAGDRASVIAAAEEMDGIWYLLDESDQAEMDDISEILKQGESR